VARRERIALPKLKNRRAFRQGAAFEITLSRRIMKSLP